MNSDRSAPVATAVYIRGTTSAAPLPEPDPVDVVLPLLPLVAEPVLAPVAAVPVAVWDTRPVLLPEIVATKVSAWEENALM